MTTFVRRRVYGRLGICYKPAPFTRRRVRRSVCSRPPESTAARRHPNVLRRATPRSTTVPPDIRQDSSDRPDINLTSEADEYGVILNKEFSVAEGHRGASFTGTRRT